MRRILRARILHGGAGVPASNASGISKLHNRHDCGDANKSKVKGLRSSRSRIDREGPELLPVARNATNGYRTLLAKKRAPCQQSAHLKFTRSKRPGGRRSSQVTSSRQRRRYLYARNRAPQPLRVKDPDRFVRIQPPRLRLLPAAAVR
jgi:hypothetical protein